MICEELARRVALLRDKLDAHGQSADIDALLGYMTEVGLRLSIRHERRIISREDGAGFEPTGRIDTWVTISWAESAESAWDLWLKDAGLTSAVVVSQLLGELIGQRDPIVFELVEEIMRDIDHLERELDQS